VGILKWLRVEMSPLPDGPARIHARNLAVPPLVSTGSLAFAKDEHDYVFVEGCSTLGGRILFFSCLCPVPVVLLQYYLGAILRDCLLSFAICDS
jgi:hypothetical protein